MQKARGRLVQENSRDDFFPHIIREKDPDISDQYICMRAHTIIIAGSETTGTLIAGVIYNLSTTPRAWYRLQTNIRTTFQTLSEINDSDKTAQLQYLVAVIEEGLRIHAPASSVCREFVRGRRPTVSTYL